MVLLAYTIFTTTLVLQRKQAARGLALGLASLTIPLVPLLLLSRLIVEANLRRGARPGSCSAACSVPRSAPTSTSRDDRPRAPRPARSRAGTVPSPCARPGAAHRNRLPSRPSSTDPTPRQPREQSQPPAPATRHEPRDEPSGQPATDPVAAHRPDGRADLTGRERHEWRDRRERRHRGLRRPDPAPRARPAWVGPGPAAAVARRDRPASRTVVQPSRPS